MRKDFGSKSWFYPLPVLIIGTYGEDGTPDAMNAAWGGLYDSDKVVLCLSAGHKTTANIRARGAFTLSFADAEHVVAASLARSSTSAWTRRCWPGTGASTSTSSAPSPLNLPATAIMCWVSG